MRIYVRLEWMQYKWTKTITRPNLLIWQNTKTVQCSRCAFVLSSLRRTYIQQHTGDAHRTADREIGFGNGSSPGYDRSTRGRSCRYKWTCDSISARQLAAAIMFRAARDNVPVLTTTERGRETKTGSLAGTSAAAAANGKMPVTSERGGRGPEGKKTVGSNVRETSRSRRRADERRENFSKIDARKRRRTTVYRCDTGKRDPMTLRAARSTRDFHVVQLVGRSRDPYPVSAWHAR